MYEKIRIVKCEKKPNKNSEKMKKKIITKYKLKRKVIF